MNVLQTFRTSIRKLRSPAVRLAAWLLVSASVIQVGSISQVLADTHDSRSLPFAEAFRESTARMLQGMEDGSCYTRKGTGRLKMAFVGIPPNNVHFNDVLRGNLNRQAKKSIERFFSWNIDLLATETLATIAKLTSINTADQLQLRKAIEKVTNTPLVFIIQAERPAKNIAQLKLELFARSGGGVQVCPKSESIFLDLTTYKSIPPTQLAAEVSDEPVVERRWAFTHALRQAAPAMRNFKSIRLSLDYQMGGNCRMRARSEAAFRNDYTDIEREMQSQFSLASGEWPTLNVATDREQDAIAKAINGEPETEATLRIQFALDPTDPDLMDLTVQLNRGKQSLLTRFMRVLVKPSDLVGCQPLSSNLLTRLSQETQSQSASFTIQPSQPTFKVGTDKVNIVIRPTEDRYFYCWIIGADETAYVLLPWSKTRAAQIWPANAAVTYPTDFSSKVIAAGDADDKYISSDIVYQKPTRELFGCFASKDRLTSSLEDTWIRMHYKNGGGGGPQGVVPKEAVASFVSQMRKTPGVEERYGWIVAVE